MNGTFNDSAVIQYVEDEKKRFTDVGGFQLLDLILPELKSHVIPYKLKSSHWLRANLVKDFFRGEY